jgi:3-methyladenine DNA glycosylase AlkD
MMKEKEIIDELKALANEEKRLFLPRFFKTGKGEYGEGDCFLGVVVPNIRIVARRNKDASMDIIEALLTSKWHEVRMCALLILVQKCHKATDEERKAMFDFYLSHTKYINNWDLVDLTAPVVVGEYLANKQRDVLYRLAESDLLWDNRIAVVATLTFIRNNDLDDIYQLAIKLMNHPHDLMHKAIGWMLREAGKRDEQRLFDFVDTHRDVMPRTMLRYAIEKFPEDKRKYLMKKNQ